MSISNLHSILNKPWYIEQSYGTSHLPLIFNILEGRQFATEKPTENKLVELTAVKGLTSSASSQAQNVAILNIKNPIVKHNQFCGPQGTKSMMRELNSLKNDDSVIGVVLDIDSGGGQVSGTPEFYDFIKDYEKPIVAYTDGLMCSAAYYIGSATSHIVANKRADAIGSIGAYSQILDLEGYYEKQGAKIHTMYASKSTQKNKAYREALEGNHKEYIKEELDPIVETFIADMKSARNGISEDVFKGAVYNAADSLEKGLIDEIGTLQTAIDKVFELSKNNKTQKQLSTMNTNFARVQAVLGMETEFESTDNGVFLNEDQLQVLETALETNETAIADATTAQETAVTEATTPLNATIETATAEATAVTEAIDAALTEAEVERGTMTNAEAVAHLSGLVTEYGQKDGAAPTNVHNDADDANTGKDNVIGGIDISAALNN